MQKEQEAKEKAKELISLFVPYVIVDDGDCDIEDEDLWLKTTEAANAKKCALLAIDFRFEAKSMYQNEIDFLNEVKAQIQKL